MIDKVKIIIITVVITFIIMLAWFTFGGWLRLQLPHCISVMSYYKVCWLYYTKAPNGEWEGIAGGMWHKWDANGDSWGVYTYE